MKGGKKGVCLGEGDEIVFARSEHEIADRMECDKTTCPTLRSHVVRLLSPGKWSKKCDDTALRGVWGKPRIP